MTHAVFGCIYAERMQLLSTHIERLGLQDKTRDICTQKLTGDKTPDKNKRVGEGQGNVHTSSAKDWSSIMAWACSTVAEAAISKQKDRTNFLKGGNLPALFYLI